MKRSGSDFLILVVLGLLGPFAPSAFADTFVVYGASGNIGTLVVEEALRRGHEVVGVSRDPASLQNEHANFSARQGDVTDPDSIVATIRGADAVIIAIGGVGPGNTPEEAVAFRAAKAYIEAASRLGDATPYVIQVGSGTTLNTNGVRVLDTLNLQAGTLLHGLYHGHWLALEAYRQSAGFDWTVMSAAYGSILQAGEFTGHYRLGDQETLFDRNGSSLLSKEDYAIAVIDMAESHTVTGKRVAVGPVW
ncbi:MAG TPA: NAD(P)H-binding protein [Gammaproteobacteria bacterium]|nr:NAD(P)H-binding protein [Gammaproteobacteria bacterium]